MKVGIFTETYRPTVNGVVVSVESFMHELEKKGLEYAIFAPSPSKPYKDPPNVYRFPSLTFPRDIVYPLAIPLPPGLIEWLLPHRIMEQLDLVHIQHFALMGQAGLVFARRHKKPAVYTYHTMAELYAENFPAVSSLAKLLIRVLTRYTANRATAVIAPTPSVKKYLLSIGVRQPISIIPTGIKTKEYGRHPRAYLSTHYKIPKEQKVLLYAGRLTKEKNISFLMDSFELIVKSLPNTHLLLAADGPDRPKVENWIEANNFAANVTIAGFLEHKEVVKLFGAADLFVFPSITDTQGIVVLEAMASGTVPVAINRLGPGDIIKNGTTGYLTNLKIEEYASTIINLLLDDEKRERVAKSAESAVGKFDIEETAEALLRLYKSLSKNNV